MFQPSSGSSSGNFEIKLTIFYLNQKLIKIKHLKILLYYNIIIKYSLLKVSNQYSDTEWMQIKDKREKSSIP